MEEPEAIDPTVEPSDTGCAECLASDGWWFHLRRCARCGHVGCCDQSPSQHATRHAMIDRLIGPPVDHSQVTHMPWVFVDGLEAHLDRSRDNGATIVQGITTHGFTSYVALGIEGRSWRFAEARPTQPR